jgi:hypothetical protein
VIGISADEPSTSLAKTVRDLLTGLEKLLGVATAGSKPRPSCVDDRFVGEGYGKPTAASREAIDILAQERSHHSRSTPTRRKPWRA